MGDGSVYECARCGGPSGQNGHYGLDGKWYCHDEVYAAYQARQVARAHEIVKNIDRPLYERSWTVTLNSYQRGNLLMLLRVCGYPFSDDRVIPFDAVNNGDWLHEIARMLDCDSDNGNANFSPDGLRHDVAWRIRNYFDEDGFQTVGPGQQGPPLFNDPVWDEMPPIGGGRSRGRK